MCWPVGRRRALLCLFGRMCWGTRTAIHCSGGWIVLSSCARSLGSRYSTHSGQRPEPRQIRTAPSASGGMGHRLRRVKRERDGSPVSTRVRYAAPNTAYRYRLLYFVSCVYLTVRAYERASPRLDSAPRPSPSPLAPRNPALPAPRAVPAVPPEARLASRLRAPSGAPRSAPRVGRKPVRGRGRADRRRWRSRSGPVSSSRDAS